MYLVTYHTDELPSVQVIGIYSTPALAYDAVDFFFKLNKFNQMTRINDPILYAYYIINDNDTDIRIQSISVDTYDHLRKVLR